LQTEEEPVEKESSSKIFSRVKKGDVSKVGGVAFGVFSKGTGGKGRV